jgi:hypothetical protein
MVLMPLLAALLTTSPPTGEASVAELITGTKGVQLRRGGGGATIAATAGAKLGSQDVVIVPANGFAVLHLLGNGHVVRLDDDLELRVGSLAMLKAKAKGQTLEDQLNRLLTRGERESKDRLLGWHVSLEGARSAAPREEQRASSAESVVKKLDTARPAPPSAPSPPPPSPKEGERASARAENKAKSLVDDDEGGPALERTRAPAPPAMPSFGPGGGPAPMQGQAEERLALDPTAGSGLRACLQAHVQQLGIGTASMYEGTFTVRARLFDGEVQLRLPDHSPAPACALAVFQRAEVRSRLTETWKTYLVNAR